MALKNVGFHIATGRRRYRLQFNPESKVAQAVLLRKDGSEANVVFASRAESEEEALTLLLEELENGSY